MLKVLQKSVLLLLLALTLPTVEAFSQAAVTVSGQVVDARTREPLAGVNIYVQDRMTGTCTDSKGWYSLTTNTPTPFTLVYSMVGFQSQEISITESRSDLNVGLAEGNVLGSEVVVTASRVEENIMRSPVSVEKMDVRAIRETPAASFYEGLQNLKTVDIITTSLGFKIINTRGFMSTSNNRFVQLLTEWTTRHQASTSPLGTW